ncbi:MAG: RNB domain-containing ribonuclease [Pseudomonadota bacterium]
MGQFSVNNLVLYKSRPARITAISDKIDIEMGAGKKLAKKRVREKDILLLHAGPVADLGALDAGEPDLDDALELLQGESLGLSDVAELLYGDDTPASCWSAWKLLDEGLYLTGSIDAITARSVEEIAADRAERDRKAQRKAAWDAMIARLKDGRMIEDDRPQMQEVEKLALGQGAASRILKALGLTEDERHAHQLLLKTGYWPPDFNPHPLRAGAVLDEPRLDVPAVAAEERLDLTGLSAVAIDDEESSDPDDAISVEGNRLWVHIADVAALAPAGSALDLAARERGANLYLPEKLISMLPDAVTQQLGLGLQQQNPALSVGFTVDEDGSLSDIVIQPSVVAVERLSYSEADQQLQSRFAEMLELTGRFRRRRHENGATSLNLPEVSVRVSDGEILIRPLERGGSREMVAEAMLAAGEAVSLFAIEHDIPIPFANQPPPEEELQPQGMAANFACRRQFKPSRLATQAERHSGLGLDSYTRVTSPLRRYPDLLTHQQLRRFLHQQPLLSHEEVTERIGASMAAAAVVRRAERFSNQHWKLVWLKRQKKWRGEAVIVALDERRATLILPDLALESRLRRTAGMELDQAVQVELQSVDFADLDVRLRLQGRR